MGRTPETDGAQEAEAMRIDDDLDLDDAELELSFARCGGPGGQKVNKTSSAVVLRFSVTSSRSLPEEVKVRLTALAGSRLDGDGVLVIHARRFRSQAKNRDDALSRLRSLIIRAMVKPVARRTTGPTRASRERRLADKRSRSALKSTRSRSPGGEAE
jgi:ribosome-associated protein